MNNPSDLESIIQERFNEIKAVPMRNPQAAARGRARFLAQAVSAGEFQRHKGWKSIFRKEQFAMNMLISILVIAGLLFGGGATVNAAQDDLPDQPLYALKLWTEDLSLQFQNGMEAKADRLMELAQIRVEEMTRLIDSGQVPPDQLRIRLQDHIQQALKLCTNLDDAGMDRTLLQLRDQLREQDRDMERLQIHATQDAQPVLDRTRTMLQERLRLVDEGLLNHEMFRNSVRNGFRYGQTQTPPAASPSVTSMPNGGGNGQATPQAISTNGAGPGPNNQSGGPNPSMTPMPKQDGSGPNRDGTGGSGSGCSGCDGSGGNGPGGMDSGGHHTEDHEPGGHRP
jgi:hypothetical protein